MIQKKQEKRQNLKYIDSEMVRKKTTRSEAYDVNMDNDAMLRNCLMNETSVDVMHLNAALHSEVLLQVLFAASEYDV